MRFDGTFDEIETTVEFNPKWGSGIGDFNNVCDPKNEYFLRLKTGKVVKSVSPGGRCIIIIGIHPEMGNIAIFHRYPKGHQDFIVANASRTLEKLLDGFDGVMSPDLLQFLFGRDVETENIGIRLKDYVRCVNKVVMSKTLKRDEHVLSKEQAKEALSKFGYDEFCMLLGSFPLNSYIEIYGKETIDGVEFAKTSTPISEYQYNTGAHVDHYYKVEDLFRMYNS
jgi:hypothetical protein